jgi:hypothetical protein
MGMIGIGIAGMVYGGGAMLGAFTPTPALALAGGGTTGAAVAVDGAALGQGAVITAGGAKVMSDGYSYAKGKPSSDISQGQPSRDLLRSPESFRGATPEEVEASVPSDWIKEPSARGGGARYHPSRLTGDQVRIMPGQASDMNPIKRGPYLRVSFHGQPSEPIPLKGNPTL